MNQNKILLFDIIIILLIILTLNLFFQCESGRIVVRSVGIRFNPTRF